jgi:quinol monooxygenase YgiN
MVIQLVKAVVKADQRERWFELIRRNAGQTRTEEGCESYRVAEDIEAPNTFLLVERCTSPEAQHAHFRTPDFSQLLADCREVLAEPPEVSIHEVASTLSLEEALASSGAGSPGG